jgi:Pin2-interacting protein X1
MSVADYFRQKLREKALARHAASGATAELPENSLARVKDEVKVDVGGVKWEGSRVTFGQDQDVKPDIDQDVKLDIKPDVKPTLTELAALDVKPDLDIKPSKEERKKAKEEKRRLKEERRALKTVVKQEAEIAAVDSAKPKKEKRKREGSDGTKEKREKHH